MLPNVFPGAGERADYNTADASLWFFEAWRAYFEATKDVATLREAFPVLCDMIEWHQKGTRYGIAVDHADGLLNAGVPGVQLTWMDAKVGDWVVTPRIGKPVEINALWYNALRVMSTFATILGEPDQASASADAAKRNFARFVRADGEGLYDVIDGPDGGDATIRPNQIFAVSLLHSPLTAVDQRTSCGRADATFSPPTDCACSRRKARATIRIIAVASWNATAATTKGRSGRGCWDCSASRRIASAATQRQPKTNWRR